ncbi:MAG: transcriptional repressor [Candidatus Cloacimonadales bacterium]
MSKRDELIAILRDYSIKVSEQRTTLLQQIDAAQQVFSADSLHHKTKGKIDLATIYRFLNILKKNHLIREVPSIDDNKCYEYALSEKPLHPHFQCEKCHEIICLRQLSSQDKAQLLGYAEQNEIKEISLVFTGLCSKCK